MNISLETIDVWEIKGGFNPSGLFFAIPRICLATDILAIGVYDAVQEIRDWLAGCHVNVERVSSREPFSIECFELNREEYPNGRAYTIHPDRAGMEVLAKLSLISNGGIEKDLFFDHLLAFRRGEPLLPIFDFHDAFVGGTFLASGLFSEGKINEFAQAVGTCAKRVQNPVCNIAK